MLLLLRMLLSVGFDVESDDCYRQLKVEKVDKYKSGPPDESFYRSFYGYIFPKTTSDECSEVMSGYTYGHRHNLRANEASQALESSRIN